MLASHFKFTPVLNQFKYISLGVLLPIFLSGCQPPQISVAQISTKKVGKTVYLSGEVIGLAPFVDRSAYQLEDPTGKIWIATTKQTPQIGQKINLKGEIAYQSLPFAEQELGEFYVIELESMPKVD